MNLKCTIYFRNLFSQRSETYIFLRFTSRKKEKKNSIESWIFCSFKKVRLVNEAINNGGTISRSAKGGKWLCGRRAERETLSHNFGHNLTYQVNNSFKNKQKSIQNINQNLVPKIKFWVLDPSSKNLFFEVQARPDEKSTCVLLDLYFSFIHHSVFMF